MCGISGYVGSPLGAPLVLAGMTRALAHRGPDGEGQELRPLASGAVVGLGHRRLAVMDPTPAGAQPMVDAETGNVITFNGEIYNFLSLRATLARLGHRFRSRSDTEVILAAYREWGEECLDRLRGMFAFAIYDASDESVFLARDRLGIKPLYYAIQGHEIVFASEVRALLASGRVRRDLDPAGLQSFLALGAVQEPLTMVANVRSIPAGHAARWRKGRLALRSYWEPSAQGSGSRGEVLDRLRRRLTDAVESQLMSDVPIGAFFSGGLDSTAIAALMRRAGGEVRTVSAVFPQFDLSEETYSREAAAYLEIPRHVVSIGRAEALSLVPRAVAAMDQPSMDGVNTYLVARAAREAGLTVALSGLGGDELFGGYPSFRRVPWLRWMVAAPRPLRWVARTLLSPWAERRDVYRKLSALLEYGERPEDAYRAVRRLFTERDVRCLQLGAVPVSTPDIPPPPAGIAADGFTRTSWLELRHYTLNVLLRDTDAMSMAHGLEVRVPFLDEQLVAEVLALPGRLKAAGGTVKPLLVAALDGMLPPLVVRRPKRGFALPFPDWLRGPLGEQVRATLTDSAASVLDREAQAAIWRSFDRGETSWHRPWALYVLTEWVRRNLERNAGEARSAADLRAGSIASPA